MRMFLLGGLAALLTWCVTWTATAQTKDPKAKPDDKPWAFRTPARPAWRYRVCAIKPSNQEKPYDRFVQEQIAGDELFPDDLDALIATGFNRNCPTEHNAKTLELHRQEILNDMTDTTGAVFLGLT